MNGEGDFSMPVFGTCPASRASRDGTCSRNDLCIHEQHGNTYWLATSVDTYFRSSNIRMEMHSSQLYVLLLKHP